MFLVGEIISEWTHFNVNITVMKEKVNYLLPDFSELRNYSTFHHNTQTRSTLVLIWLCGC
jgi:hypothetical protein